MRFARLLTYYNKINFALTTVTFIRISALLRFHFIFLLFVLSSVLHPISVSKYDPNTDEVSRVVREFKYDTRTYVVQKSEAEKYNDKGQSEKQRKRTQKKTQ